MITERDQLAWEPGLVGLADRTEASFERMRVDTERRAYSMALQLTRNKCDAEDLLQETYAKAWRGFGSYMPGRPFLNWLLRIMQRAYLDSRRRENPIRKAESLQTMATGMDGDVQEISIADEQMSAEHGLLLDEFAEETRRALAELPEVYRSAIVLCDIEQLSYQEIADSQNTTVGTVRSRIHRGRKILRDIMIKHGIGHAPHVRHVG
jgi:RNA polymerase sigma-70 factor, ECF subfamily